MQISPSIQDTMYEHVIVFHLINNSIWFEVDFKKVIYIDSFKFRRNMTSIRLMIKTFNSFF